MATLKNVLLNSYDLNMWAAITVKRILSNMVKLGIGTGKSSTGNLKRSIYWTVYNAAGGDKAKIDFFYLNYAKFVETGTGAGVRYLPMPREMVKMESIERERTKRKAKPFYMSEVRVQTRMLLEKIALQYGYEGSAYLSGQLAVPGEGREATRQWISDNAQALDAAGIKVDV